MKKIILVFLLIFMLSTVAESSDILDSLRQYEVQIKLNLGVDSNNTTYIPTGALDNLIREAMAFVIPLVDGIESTQSDTTKYRLGAYSLTGTVSGIRNIYWSKNDSVKTFVYMPKQLWYQLEIKTLLGEGEYERRPSYYDYDQSSYYLYPTPVISGDTIKVEVFTEILNINSSVDFSSLPSRYRSVVLWLATYNIAVAKQHPASEMFYKNYLMAGKSIEKYERKVNAPTPNTPN